MTEMQMIFLFCVIYSGAFSVVIWANMVAQSRMEAHFQKEDLSGQFDRGA